ncbi:hypothetical protein [Lederbergia graminis]|uniref:ATP synthase F0 subunit 8 n=1 Tax=Lederbergia graminis TaxID=735518 RepID=A0ABW0LKX5_9BACI
MNTNFKYAIFAFLMYFVLRTLGVPRSFMAWMIGIFAVVVIYFVLTDIWKEKQKVE